MNKQIYYISIKGKQQIHFGGIESWQIRMKERQWDLEQKWQDKVTRHQSLAE